SKYAQQRLVDGTDRICRKQRPVPAREPSLCNDAPQPLVFVVDAPDQGPEVGMEWCVPMDELQVGRLSRVRLLQEGADPSQHLVRRRLGRKADEEASVAAFSSPSLGEEQRRLRLPLSHGRLDEYEARLVHL